MIRQNLRIGLIGTGNHACEIILPTLILTPNARVVALADTDNSRFQLAKIFCPDAFTTLEYESLCTDPSLDAIVVVATPQVHAHAAELALQHGKHVFVEKPLAVDSERAHHLESLASAVNRVGMVGHNFRFAPAFDRIRLIMADKGFGECAHVEISFLASKPRGSRWGLEPIRSFLLSHASHALDIAIDLLGNGPLKVHYASVRNHRDALFAAIILTNSKGHQAVVNVTNGAPHFDLSLRIVGSHDSMIQMPSLREVRNFGDPDHFKRIGQIWVPPTLATGFNEPGYAAEMTTFVQAALQSVPVTPSFADGACVLDLIEQIIQITSVSENSNKT